MREARGGGGGGGVEFVDVGGDVGCGVEVRETDAPGGVLILVVCVLVHVEEVGVGPVVAGVGEEDGFVLFWVGVGVGDVVDMAGVGAGAEGVDGRERELKDFLLEVGGVFLLAEN